MRQGREVKWVSWLIVALWSMVIFVTIPLARAIQRFVQKAWGEEVFLYAVLIAIIAALGLTLAQQRGWPLRGEPLPFSY